MTETEFKLAIQEVGQARFAALVGISTTHMNRIYSGESGIMLEHLGPMLHGMGLKIVPDDTEIMHIKRNQLEFLRTAFEMVLDNE